MSDIIENNMTGIVIDPYDAKKWAESIIWLIKNPQESKKMGEKGNYILKTQYSQELFYKNIINMYNDVLK